MKEFKDMLTYQRILGMIEPSSPLDVSQLEDIIGWLQTHHDETQAMITHFCRLKRTAWAQEMASVLTPGS